MQTQQKLVYIGQTPIYERAAFSSAPSLFRCIAAAGN